MNIKKYIYITSFDNYLDPYHHNNNYNRKYYK